MFTSSKYKHQKKAESLMIPLFGDIFHIVPPESLDCTSHITLRPCGQETDHPAYSFLPPFSFLLSFDLYRPVTHIAAQDTTEHKIQKFKLVLVTPEMDVLCFL